MSFIYIPPFLLGVFKSYSFIFIFTHQWEIKPLNVNLNSYYNIIKAIFYEYCSDYIKMYVHHKQSKGSLYSRKFYRLLKNLTSKYSANIASKTKLPAFVIITGSVRTIPALA